MPAKETALISVIVPYKNAEAYLERALESLHKQDGSFEFILVDDHSTDESAKIAKKYEKMDNRFVLVENERKAGVSGARNTGLNYAISEWITFLDADDEMNEGAFKMFRDAIELFSIHYNVYQFNHYRHYSSINKTALKYTNPTGEFEIPDVPILWCVVWNKLYNAKFLKGIKFDESMNFAEDEMFNLECLAKDGRIFCAKGITTTHYFDNEKSLSKSKTEKDILKHAEALTRFVKKNDDPALRRAACLRLAEHWSHLFIDVLGGSNDA